MKLKDLLVCSMSKHMSEAHFHMGYDVVVYRWGMSLRIFFYLRENNAPGVVLPFVDRVVSLISKYGYRLNHVLPFFFWETVPLRYQLNRTLLVHQSIAPAGFLCHSSVLTWACPVCACTASHNLILERGHACGCVLTLLLMTPCCARYAAVCLLRTNKLNY